MYKYDKIATYCLTVGTLESLDPGSLALQLHYCRSTGNNLVYLRSRELFGQQQTHSTEERSLAMEDDGYDEPWLLAGLSEQDLRDKFGMKEGHARRVFHHLSQLQVDSQPQAQTQTPRGVVEDEENGMTSAFRRGRTGAAEADIEPGYDADYDTDAGAEARLSSVALHDWPFTSLFPSQRACSATRADDRTQNTEQLPVALHRVVGNRGAHVRTGGGAVERDAARCHVRGILRGGGEKR